MPGKFTRAASVSVQTRSPCIDLKTLLECLADAIPALADANKDIHKLPLFAYHPDPQALGVQTHGVLARLRTVKHFDRLKPVDKQGFIRHLEVPKGGQRAWLGCRIVEGDDKGVSEAVTRLAEAIDHELDASFNKKNLSPRDLLIRDPATHLRTIAKNLNVKNPGQLFQGRVRFKQVRLDTAHERSKGRVFTSVEAVHGGRADNLDRLLAACRYELEADGDLDEDEIEARCDTLREQADTGQKGQKSQINRVLDFLEETALARVRLEICFELLDSLAAYLEKRQGKQNLPEKHAQVWPFVEYVRRVQAFYRLLTAENADTTAVSLSLHFPESDFNLNEDAAKVRLYDCLPIFPEPAAQIFEHKSGKEIVREISYRFRINGNNPEQHMPAFTARLQRIRKVLANPQEAPPGKIRFSLSELLALWAVMPDDRPREEAALRNSVRQRIAELLDKLKRQGSYGAVEAIDSLLGRQRHMEEAASCLVYAMRQTGSAQGERQRVFYLNIMPGLINQEQLAGPMREVFGPSALAEREQGNKEQVHFLHNVRVTRDDPEVACLLSIKVDIRLGEGYLTATGEQTELQVERVLPENLLQVLWQPVDCPDTSLHREFINPRRIVFRYQNGHLQSSGRNDDTGMQLLAAHRTAFTVLCYMVMMRLLHRVRNAEQDPPHVLALRLQTHVRTNDPLTSASNAVYAASQAFEHALNRDCPCRLQGLIVNVSPDSSTQEKDRFFYRKRSAFYAMCAGFSVRIKDNRPDNSPLQQAGVVTFNTRPCDFHPEISDAGGFTVTMRAYRLQCAADGCRLDIDTVRVSTDDGKDAESRPLLIRDELRRLYDDGVRHVIYLVHRFSERRIGRSRAQQRVYDSADFLNRLLAEFPGLILYPVVRDVFPAVRLARQDKRGQEGAYEIIGVGEAGYRLPESFSDTRTNHTPVYSIATLRIVGKNEDQKPQSGICTYFLLRDFRETDQQRVEAVSRFLLPEFGGRNELLMALRGIHILESEEAGKNGLLRPVLDPYRWISPDSLEGAGDIPVIQHNRKGANRPVVLSLQAVLARVSDILHR
ncbi:MAG: hypothetical protein GY862_01495 [Gammaproteobacteria bacterium]|nr:hypothetical protein [Gammaproteobacteria bacterium]